jgi:hypothetical protein
MRQEEVFEIVPVSLFETRRTQKGFLLIDGVHRRRRTSLPNIKAAVICMSALKFERISRN